MSSPSRRSPALSRPGRSPNALSPPELLKRWYARVPPQITIPIFIVCAVWTAFGSAVPHGYQIKALWATVPLMIFAAGAAILRRAQQLKVAGKSRSELVAWSLVATSVCTCFI
jgi:hypothetical protein